MREIVPPQCFISRLSWLWHSPRGQCLNRNVRRPRALLRHSPIIRVEMRPRSARCYCSSVLFQPTFGWTERQVSVVVRGRPLGNVRETRFWSWCSAQRASHPLIAAIPGIEERVVLKFLPGSCIMRIDRNWVKGLSDVPPARTSRIQAEKMRIYTHEVRPLSFKRRLEKQMPARAMGAHPPLRTISTYGCVNEQRYPLTQSEKNVAQLRSKEMSSSVCLRLKAALSLAQWEDHHNEYPFWLFSSPIRPAFRLGTARLAFAPLINDWD